MADEKMLLLRSSFPVTGQPVRVIMIAGAPWFATADVCKVLGRSQATRASRLVDPAETCTVDMRTVCLTPNKAYGVSTAQKVSVRGNPTLNLISESGLYTLIMRSDKPAAKPFREWVTHELLPSIRRGDTDVADQQARMAETLAEAIGRNVAVIAELAGTVDDGIRMMSDGTVHCRHGEMELCPPDPEGPGGPPFGPYYRCADAERVGIRGSKEVRSCAPVKLVDVARRLADGSMAGPRGPEPAGSVDTGRLFYSVREQRIYGSARQIAEVLRAMDPQLSV